MSVYYGNGGPGPHDRLLRVDAPDDGSHEEWRLAKAFVYSGRDHAWYPYPNAQLDIQFLGEYFLVDEDEVPQIQRYLHERAEQFAGK
jgi:hypothetical protein